MNPDSPLNGKLVEAWKGHTLTHLSTPSLARVLLTTEDGSKPRLSSHVGRVLVGDIPTPTSPLPGAWHEYQRQVHGRLMETGVFNSVGVSVREAGGAKSHPTPSPSAVLPSASTPPTVEVVATLDEGSYSLEQETGLDGAGRPHASTSATLVSPFGQGMRFAVKLGSPVADKAMATMADSAMASAGPSKPAPDAAPALDGGASVGGGQRSLAHTPWLVGSLLITKPTLGNTRNRLNASLGSYFTDHVSDSGLVTRGVAGSLGVCTPDGTSSLTWGGDMRHTGFVWPTTRPVNTGLPRALVHSCGPSFLSSLSFKTGGGRVEREAGGLPVGGGSTSLHLQATHPVLGSHESWLRGEVSSTAAVSVWRAMPDQGVAAPLMGRGAADVEVAADAAAGLAPPRPASHLPGLSWLAAGGPWSKWVADLAAAWVAPGITLQGKASGGVLVPLPPQPRRVPIAVPTAESGDDAAVMAPWSHYLDRYTLGASAVPGFHPSGIGPRARGRAVGGTLQASGGVKVLLPPPLPIPFLTHIGLRCHAWAAGGVCVDGPSSLLGAPTLTALAAHAAASAGIGLTLPLPIAPGAAIELNWRLAAHVPHAPGHSGVLGATALAARLAL